MSKHDDLLGQGPREAPEPETAEQKSKKLGLRTAGGGIAGGGIAALKLGFLGKFFIWFFAWRGIVDAWRVGGWVAGALLLAALTTFLVLRSRRSTG